MSTLTETPAPTAAMDCCPTGSETPESIDDMGACDATASGSANPAASGSANPAASGCEGCQKSSSTKGVRNRTTPSRKKNDDDDEEQQPPKKRSRTSGVTTRRGKVFVRDEDDENDNDQEESAKSKTRTPARSGTKRRESVQQAVMDSDCSSSCQSDDGTSESDASADDRERTSGSSRNKGGPKKGAGGKKQSTSGGSKRGNDRPDGVKSSSKRKKESSAGRSKKKATRNPRSDSEQEGDSGTEGKSRKKTSKPTKRAPTKVKDNVGTLLNYRMRISKWDADLFAPLDGAYLSDFHLQTLDPNEPNPTHHAVILKEVAEKHGFRVRGFASENKKAGKYVHPLPDGELRTEEGGTAKVVYVGAFSRFTQHEKSPFCVEKEDEAWMKVDPDCPSASSSSSS